MARPTVRLATKRARLATLDSRPNAIRLVNVWLATFSGSCVLSSSVHGVVRSQDVLQF